MWIAVMVWSCREEFHGIVLSLEKIHRDSRQLVKGGSTQMTVKQLQQRLGVKPSLQDCLDGLMLLHDMHHSEYGSCQSSSGERFAYALPSCWAWKVAHYICEKKRRMYQQDCQCMSYTHTCWSQFYSWINSFPSRYLLKSSIISALPTVILRPRWWLAFLFSNWTGKESPCSWTNVFPPFSFNN